MAPTDSSLKAGAVGLFLTVLGYQNLKLLPISDEFISYSGRVFVADQEEVNRICEEYQKIGDKYELFERMFVQLFIEEEVKLSVHFGLDNLNENDLRKDQRFRTHVGKFQRFFTGILEMLSKGPKEAENIVQVLRIVGRQHGNVRSMSFTAEKWLIFKNVLLSLLCRDNSATLSPSILQDSLLLVYKGVESRSTGQGFNKEGFSTSLSDQRRSGYATGNYKQKS
ncbi:unnamed protein product [Angiostrongylus costaricensis]|uniref:GLOBIN domain-containing protein n=1 Tax=Angiostrongylus costaricensis TaxID=334426 RepID=A0A0R3PJ86_ANGCS|nr:unnamed protein product [Angiostrongylus costaricensis]